MDMEAWRLEEKGSLNMQSEKDENIILQNSRSICQNPPYPETQIQS
jgi:hypothetical protein